MPASQIVICYPVRTAIGKFGGTLKAMPVTALGAAAVKAVLECSGLAPSNIDGAVFGHIVKAGVGMKSARQAALKGNLVCGSGEEAIASA